MVADSEAQWPPLLRSALDRLEEGVAVFDRRLQLAYCNVPFRKLRAYPESVCRVGAHISELYRHNARRGDYGTEDVEEAVARRVSLAERRVARTFDQSLPDGTVLYVRYAPLDGDGLLFTYEDVTEKRRTETALDRSQRRNALVAEATTEGIYEWRVTDGEFHASPRLAALLGYETEVPGPRDWNWSARIHPDDREQYENTLATALFDEARYSCEYRIRHEGGNYLWIHDRGIVSERGEDGRPECFIGAVLDVTDRKLAQMRLQESDERFALAVEAFNEGVYDWNIDTDQIYYSPRVKEVLGLSMDDIETVQDWVDRIHPEDLEHYRQSITAHLRGETDRMDVEYRYQARDGSWHWARQHGLALRRPDGRAYRMAGSTGDITERKVLQAELEVVRGRLLDAIEAISEGFALFDADDRLVLCNSVYRNYFADLAEIVVPGTPFQTIVRSALEHGVFPLAVGQEQAWLRSLMERRGQGTGSRLQYMSNGLWLQVSDHRVSEGGLVSVYVDVTELKRREEELSELVQRVEEARDEAEVARTRFMEAIETISEGFVLFDAEYKLVLCNSVYRDYYQDQAVKALIVPGTPRWTITRAAAEHGLFPAAEGRVEEFLREHIGKVRDERGIREQQLRGDIWLQISTHEMSDGGKVSVYTDITDLKRRESELAESERRVRAILEASPVGVGVTRRDGTRLFGNSRAAELIGMTPEEFMRHNTRRDYVNLADRDRLMTAIDADGYVRDFEVEMRRTDGRSLWVLLSTNPIEFEGGPASLTYLYDISERKQAERELAAKEAQLRSTIENMSAAIYLVDAELRLRVWNSRFQALYDIPGDLLCAGASLEDVIRLRAARGEYGEGNPTELVAQRIAEFRNPGPLQVEVSLPGGRVGDTVRAPTEDGGMVVLTSDITQRKRMEVELRTAKDEAERTLEELRLAQRSLVQAEKMASLGQLTAGIAHEIKNPLHFINNFSKSSLELLGELSALLAPVREQLETTVKAEVDELIETIDEDLGTILEHGERADGIVKGMLLHSRGDSGDRHLVDLNALVAESINLAYHGQRATTPGFNVTVERALDSAVGEFEVVRQELSRVFVNLLGNAFYAVGKREQQKEPGYAPTVSVTTRLMDSDRAEIRVRDNGTGMSSETLQQLFTPFFSTKPPGEGTGLGLSISHDIVVEQHGGAMSADSEPGEFAEFVIELPRRLASAPGRDRDGR